MAKAAVMLSLIMGRSVLSRLRAAVMVACFLSAGIVLPDLDAIWFHGTRGQVESRPHVEATGSDSCHAEKCVLGAGLPRSQVSNGDLTEFTRFDELAAPFLPFAPSIPDRTPSGSSHSRAPPSSSVS
jgi:hypothetical protein